jgi:hypothetical protein
VRFECVAVKESKGGVGFVNEEKKSEGELSAGLNGGGQRC